MKFKDFSKVNFITQDNANAQRESTLMSKLPAEVREEIWTLTFANSVVKALYYDNQSSTQPTSRKQKKKAMYQSKKYKPRPPGILVSCKQAHAEAIKLYWSLSTFYIGEARTVPPRKLFKNDRPRDAARPTDWLLSVGRRRRELLQDVKVHPFLHGDRGLTYLCVQIAVAELRASHAATKGLAAGVVKVRMRVPRGFGGPGKGPFEEIWTTDPESAIEPQFDSAHPGQ